MFQRQRPPRPCRSIRECQSFARFTLAKLFSLSFGRSFLAFSPLTVEQISLQTWWGLFALPASRMIDRRLRLPTWLCCFQGSSSPFYRYLRSVLGACLWSSFLESALSTGEPIRTTCPSQPNCHFFKRLHMVGVPAHSRIFSCQQMFSRCRRQWTWKSLSFRSCAARCFQVSLLYKRLLTLHCKLGPRCFSACRCSIFTVDGVVTTLPICLLSSVSRERVNLK